MVLDIVIGHDVFSFCFENRATSTPVGFWLHGADAEHPEGMELQALLFMAENTTPHGYGD